MESEFITVMLDHCIVKSNQIMATKIEIYYK